MFSIRSNNAPTKAPPLNAISPIAPDEEARTARGLAICAELAEMGIALTRLAAKSATIQLTEAAKPQPEQAPKPANTPDQATLFLRLASFTRQCVALEARIARTPRPTCQPQPKPPAPETTAAILVPQDDDEEQDHFEAMLAACPDDETLLTTLKSELAAAAKFLGVNQATGPPG